jgi:ABC-type amino acid transport substrate-binding protein
MKKLINLLCFVFVFINIVGCGGKKAESINNIADLKDKVIAFLSQGTSAKNDEALLSELLGGKPKQIVYFNRVSDISTALLSGKADAYVCHNFVADYLLKRNNNLKTIPYPKKMDSGFIMAVRSEDQQLKSDLDSAITILQNNGVLKALQDKWITNFPADHEPSSNVVSKIDGAKTIYVGVCGDYPPLDYIAADGRPAGYNVVFLQEIGKLLNINFEFVSLENQARFVALNSKKIDVIFTHFFSNSTHFYDELKNNSWLATIPYFKYEGKTVLVRK